MPTVKFPGVREIAEEALRIALGYAAAGVREEGGNNRGDQVEFFQSLWGGAPGESWCAYFVSTCFVKAYLVSNGKPATRESMRNCVGEVKSIFSFGGYCPALHREAKRRGLWRTPGFTPYPGDFVLFDFHGQGEPHHIGIVVEKTPLTLRTVEGNASPDVHGSQADGDGVYEKRRSAHIFGYIHWADAHGG